jgi:hypothetical protein
MAQGYAITTTPDHNYAIAGERDNQGLVMKVNQDGTILWSKKAVAPYSSTFQCIASTNDSCLLSAGNATVNTSGAFQIVCVKMTSSGDTVWTRVIDLGNTVYVHSVRQTADHGFVLTGFQYQDVAPNVKIFVMRLDSAGNLVWNKFYTAGGVENYAFSIRQTSDGGYILTGNIQNWTPFSSAALLMKLTPEGTVMWAKRMALVSNDFLSCWDVVETPTGFLGLIKSDNNGIIFLKTDLSGNVLFSSYYYLFLPNQMVNYPRPKLKPTHDGGFVFSPSGWGFSEGLIKIDSAGNILLGQAMVLIPSDVVESPDKGFMLLGNGPVMGVDVTPTDHPQIGVIKTDSGGNSLGCIWWNNFIASNAIIVNATDVTTTTTSGGQMSSLHIPMVNDNLSIFEGCVAVIGDVNEQKDSENSVIVSPNPSDGHFQISVNSGNQETIEGITVFNSMGEMVYESIIPTSNPIAIDLSSRPDGVYLVQTRIKGQIFLNTVVVID